MFLKTETTNAGIRRDIAVTNPTLHRGKLARTPKVLSVRPLTREDMRALQAPRPPQNRPRAMREAHHRLARMVAAGFRIEEILRLTGYSYNRLLQLRKDPAFEELVTQYRGKVDEAWVRSQDEVQETAAELIRRSLRQVEEHYDQADESGELIPLKTLITVGADLMDRFGYGKKSIQRNENLDFAAMMEQIARASGKSNVIDAKPLFGNRGATLDAEIPASRLVTSGDDGGTDG